MSSENVSGGSPPYVSFQTFLNFLDRLAANGIPQYIDRSYWGSFMSGTYGLQVTSALRFLGLIADPSLEPVPLLEKVVSAEDRKATLQDIIKGHYQPIFESIDLARATKGQLEQAFAKEFKLEGETRRKAVTFFVHAAQYADIELSSFILNSSKKRPSPGRTAKKAPSRKRQTSLRGEPSERKAPERQEPTAPPVSMPPSGSTKTITLRSGGTVAISVSVNLLELPPGDDRTFVFHLIDMVNDYERSTQDRRGTDVEEEQLVN